MIKNKPMQIPIDAPWLFDLIASNQDSVFIFNFWFSGITLELNYSYHLCIIYKNIN